MGYYDDKWDLAPGYCVSCDKLRPLDKAAVCEECYYQHPISLCADWEESKKRSKWYYERLKEDSSIKFERNIEYLPEY